MLGYYLGFIIHEKTPQDIGAYVRSTHNAQITRRHNEQKREVELPAKEIVKKASGVFVWVKLVVDDLALEGSWMATQYRNFAVDLPLSLTISRLYAPECDRN